jgi:predicted transcriptional regulator
MSSPVLRTRVPEPLAERVRVCAQARGVSPSRFLREALADRCEAMETITHVALRVQAREAAAGARAEGDLRLAHLLDGLLLRLDVADALLGAG